jgi:hypothetical protein
MNEGCKRGAEHVFLLRQDGLRGLADLLEKLRASSEHLKKLVLQCDLLIKHPNDLTPSIPRTVESADTASSKL